MLKKIMLVFGLVLSLSPSSVFAEEGKAVLIVNGKSYYEADLTAILGQIPGGQKVDLSKTSEIDPNVMDYLIERALLLEQADKDKLAETDDFRAQLAKAREDILLRSVVAKLRTKFVSEDIVYQYFLKNADSFEVSSEFNAAHILVASEEEAKAARERVAGGEDFAELAKSLSKDPSAQQNGGDLGFFDVSAMVPEFGAAVSAMEIGELSEPVKTQFGFHIIKLIEKRDAKNPKYEDVKGQISQKLLSEGFQTHLQKLKDDAEITIPE